MTYNTDPIRPIGTERDGVLLGRAEFPGRVQRRERPAEDEGRRGGAHHHAQDGADQGDHSSIWQADDPHEEPARAAGAYDDHGRVGPLEQARLNLLRHLDTTA